MRQLLQSDTDNSYQKFVTKSDRGLFQVRQVLQSVTEVYYKVR